MSRIVSQLVLAMLLLPALALAYTIAFALLEELTRLNGEACLFYAGLVTFALVMLFWTLLWRTSVRWTGNRVLLTIGTTLGVVGFTGAVAWLLAEAAGDMFGLFMWGALSCVLWPIASILIWRETRGERLDRLGRFKGGREVLACPVCNYDLTDQREARCPECGGVFTLGSLVAAGDRDSESSISAGA
ncbi:MAG: hypothetical protein AAGA55_04565 [Planctomycetota bacterium]